MHPHLDACEVRVAGVREVDAGLCHLGDEGRVGACLRRGRRAVVVDDVLLVLVDPAQEGDVAGSVQLQGVREGRVVPVCRGVGRGGVKRFACLLDAVVRLRLRLGQHATYNAVGGADGGGVAAGLEEGAEGVGDLRVVHVGEADVVVVK